MNNTMNIKLDNGAYIPTRAHKTDAGYDLYSTDNYDLKPGERIALLVGVHFQIPNGYCGLVVNRSGLNFNKGVTLHGNGLIDSGYRGAVQVKLYNDGDTVCEIRKGERIAQIIFIKVFTPDLVEVDELDESDRGNDGFGSSGL